MPGDEEEGFTLGDEEDDEFARSVPDAPATQAAPKRRRRGVATQPTEERQLRPDGTISSGKPWTPALEEERARFPKDLDLLFPAVDARPAKRTCKRFAS